MRPPSKPIPALLPHEVELFHSRILYRDDGCSLWLGPFDKQGYGVLNFSRERCQFHLRAHRVAYKLATGQDPAPFLVLHACDTPPCCTPACLRVGTNLENVHDMVSRGRVKNQFPQLDTPEERLATGLKICTTCMVRLPLEAFCINRKTADGRQSKCRECLKAQASDPSRWTSTNQYLASLGFGGESA